MISKEEMKSALYRSGYLLESRVANWFSENGFFVEPNFTFYDSLSQKSREIDLIVDNTNGFSENNKKITCKTDFIIETINNDRPLVFFSNRNFIDSDELFSQINYISTFPKSENDFLFLIDYNNLHYFKEIIATQYCSFQEKKKTRESNKVDWMAYHPDDLYDNFRKLLFCSKKILADRKEIFNNSNWYRLFRYQPLLVLENNLLEAKVNGKEIQLLDKKMISFCFNHTMENEHHSIIIDVITEDFLNEYINSIALEDEIILKDMIEIYHKYIK